MTTEDFASKLNGRHYGSELTKDDIELARQLGFVVVYGCSDDLAEFDGAIHDEVGCWEGGVIYNKNHRRITARWCKTEEYSWTYYTKIPHAVFDIYDGDEKYCQGIVLRVEDMQ